MTEWNSSTDEKLLVRRYARRFKKEHCWESKYDSRRIKDTLEDIAEYRGKLHKSSVCVKQHRQHEYTRKKLEEAEQQAEELETIFRSKGCGSMPDWRRKAKQFKRR